MALSLQEIALSLAVAALPLIDAVIRGGTATGWHP